MERPTAQTLTRRETSLQGYMFPVYSTFVFPPNSPDSQERTLELLLASSGNFEDDDDKSDWDLRVGLIEKLFRDNIGYVDCYWFKGDVLKEHGYLSFTRNKENGFNYYDSNQLTYDFDFSKLIKYGRIIERGLHRKNGIPGSVRNHPIYNHLFNNTLMNLGFLPSENPFEYIGVENSSEDECSELLLFGGYFENHFFSYRPENKPDDTERDLSLRLKATDYDRENPAMRKRVDHCFTDLLLPLVVELEETFCDAVYIDRYMFDHEGLFICHQWEHNVPSKKRVPINRGYDKDIQKLADYISPISDMLSTPKHLDHVFESHPTIWHLRDRSVWNLFDQTKIKPRRVLEIYAA